MSESRRRAAILVGVLAVTGAATWFAWPRPSLELRVELGGRALIVDEWGKTTPLPETVYVKANGSNTRVRIDNRDTTYQTLGVFGAAAKTVRSFSLPLPGMYPGYCSAHAASRTITYVVR